MSAEMTTEEVYKSSLEHFRSREDIEKVHTILEWLTVIGYEIDKDHEFVYGNQESDDEPKGYVRVTKINGITIQGHCFNEKKEIEVFIFYTTDGNHYRIDIDNWAAAILDEGPIAPEMIEKVVQKL